jgi:hypothetical protein
LELTGSSITPTDLSTLATDIAGSWNTRIGGAVPASVVLTGVDIVYVPSVGNEVVANVSVSHTGTFGGTDIQNVATSFVINWSISAYYRGGHPRWYLPGLVEADVTNGSSINSGRATGMATNANNFRLDINGYTTTNISAVQMGTLSFQTGNVWRGTPIFRPFTGASTRTLVGQQRRRIKS